MRVFKEFFGCAKLCLVFTINLFVGFLVIPCHVIGEWSSCEESVLDKTMISRKFTVERNGEIILGGSLSGTGHAGTGCTIVDVASDEIVWELSREDQTQLSENGSFEKHIHLPDGKYVCSYENGFSDLYIWKMDKIDLLERTDEFTSIEKKLYSIETSLEDGKEEVILKKQDVGSVIVEKMINDQLLEPDKDFKIHFTHRALYINGKEQNHAIYKKYKLLYEKEMGNELNADTEITIKRRTY